MLPSEITLSLNFQTQLIRQYNDFLCIKIQSCLLGGKFGEQGFANLYHNKNDMIGIIEDERTFTFFRYKKALAQCETKSG